MKAKRLYSQEVIPDNLVLVKECKGTHPSSIDPILYVCYRAYDRDYRWKLVELAPNKREHPFAFDHPDNKYVGSGVYRHDLFAQIGVLGPAQSLERPQINIDKEEE